MAVLLAAATVAAVAASGRGRAVIPNDPASQLPRRLPITDPTRLDRLAFDDLSYQGAFRLPPDEVGGVSFSLGGGPAAYNRENDSLFIGARGGSVAEVSVPQPVNSANIDELPFARLLQPFADPSEGRIKSDVAEEGVSLSGLLVHERRLLGSAVIYYDANNTQAVSHFSRPLKLADRGVGKLVRLGPGGKTGFVAGYMAAVPPEWQSRLGGPVITGQCCLPIITRTSWGPAAFAFEPADIVAGRNGAVVPLLFYDAAHPTLGLWEASNPVYGGTMQLGGAALIDRTRTALFVGRNGTGPFCYGNGTADQALANARDKGGEPVCFDPTTSDKGQHAYPYRYQIWAYDLAELAEVRAGRRDPWAVKPYGVWPIDFPIAEPGVRIGGVAYDPSARRLFVTQLQADRDGYAYRPLIHVFRIP